jgi:tetratricopeptide (TPR) repeat protein
LLSEHRQAARLLESLDELVASGLVRATGQHYSLDQEGLRSVLQESLQSSGKLQPHLRLAELFERRGDEFRRAQHLVYGGEVERGLDVLIAHAEASRQETGANPVAYSNLLRALPEDWFAFYELGMKLCTERGRPPKHAYQILIRLAGLMSVSLGNHDGARHYAVLLEQLYRAAGLDIYDSLGSSLEPADRLRQALRLARQRYEENPDTDIVTDPGTAIPQLVRVLLEALGLVAFSNDYAFLKQLPSLAPLEPLSPSLAIAIRLSVGVTARITGRAEKSLTFYRDYIDRLLRPDGAGLPVTLRLYTRLRVMGGVGIQEATMGLATSLTLADEIQVHPLCETTGVVIRMLYHLWQGDVREAERYKREAEVLQIQSTSRQVFGGQHLLSELSAHALADDLTRVKRTTDLVEPLALVHKGWAPVLHYGRGEYHRIRGDYSSALSEFEAALGLMEAGRHQIWPFAAGAHVRTLFELHQYERAKTHAESYLAIAAERELGYTQNYLKMPLGLVESKLGHHAGAVSILESVIDSFKALGTTGLSLAVAYETLACIALTASDRSTFEHYAALAAEQLGGSGGRLLGAKYERLAASAKRLDGSDVGVGELTVLSEFNSTLQSCKDSPARARYGLEILIRSSGALGGLLYISTKEGLIRSGRVGDFEPDPRIEELAHGYFSSESTDREITRSVMAPSTIGTACEWRGSGDARYIPVLLTHQCSGGFALTGLAVLLVTPDGHFVYPRRLAEEFSRLSLELGDASPVYA